MKNVIYVLVDALSYDNVGARDFKETPTPFLDRLKNSSLSCERLYTQGPYTEAAFISGFCGENTLDHGGYMLGLSRCNMTYPTVFKEQGYTTLMTYSPYVCAGSYIRGVDEYFYSRIYSIQPLLLYRFQHFHEKHVRAQMSDAEYEACMEMLEDAFVTWKDQLQALKENKDCVVLIADLVNDPKRIETVLDEVTREYVLFTNDRLSYVKELFDEWKDHRLLKIENISIKKKQSEETKDFILSEYAEELRHIQELHNERNRKNNKIDWKYLYDLCRNDEEGWRAARRTYHTYKERFQDHEIIDEICRSVEEEKVTISAYRQLQCFEKRIVQLDAEDKAYFSFIHLEDFHLPSMYYSYDIDDKDILRKEFTAAVSYAKKVPDNYRGSLLADLSVNYLDRKLADFYHTLKAKLHHDFVFVVTADHGYPSNYNPPRPLIFNSFYQENYHIPFILHDTSCKCGGGRIDGLYSSLDIMPQILKTCGISKKDTLSDYEIDSGKDRDYVLIEYPGPGCPEINTKKIYYAIYDGRYKIGCKEFLDRDISGDSVNGIFDLQKDPYEYVNLKRKLLKRNDAHVNALIEIINQRHRVIREKFAGVKFYPALMENLDRSRS